MAKLRFLAPLVWTTVPLLALDQFTKWAVVTGRMPRGTVIPNLLKLNYIQNTGAAFGIMRGWNWAFVGATLVGIMLIAIYYYRFRDQLGARIALGCLLGGALGNLIDRIGRQAVVDFVHFRSWWIFNVADVAAFTGACLLVIYLSQQEKTDSVDAHEHDPII